MISLEEKLVLQMERLKQERYLNCKTLYLTRDREANKGLMELINAGEPAHLSRSEDDELTIKIGSYVIKIRDGFDAGEVSIESFMFLSSHNDMFAEFSPRIDVVKTVIRLYLFQ